MIADLPVPDQELVGKPVLPNQHTPADYHGYVNARTSVWQAARDAGQAPGGATVAR